MTEINREINKREAFLIKGAFALLLILSLCRFWGQSWHFALFMGYILGLACFVILCKTVVGLINKAKKSVFIYVFASNLKLFGVAGIVYLLNIHGFSVIEVFAGIVLCHFMLFSSYFFNFLSKKLNKGICGNALT